MNVNDVVAARVDAARIRIQAARRRRDELSAARRRGLAARHAAKLRNLDSICPPDGTPGETKSATEFPERNHLMSGKTTAAAAAAAAVARAQALHSDNGTGWCPEEGLVRWPCATARALDTSLSAPTVPKVDPSRDRLCEMSRALDRADALADGWADDLTPITRNHAAEMISAVITLNGWTRTDAPPAAALRAVPTSPKENC